ncbi:MAG: hypothetical protein H6644_15370 [Caldilineaceae bacterium]|nr:hypothetical protein [Caldilineaceae bacterium]
MRRTLLRGEEIGRVEDARNQAEEGADPHTVSKVRAEDQRSPRHGGGQAQPEEPPQSFAEEEHRAQRHPDRRRVGHERRVGRAAEQNARVPEDEIAAEEDACFAAMRTSRHGGVPCVHAPGKGHRQHRGGNPHAVKPVTVSGALAQLMKMAEKLMKRIPSPNATYAVTSVWGVACFSLGRVVVTCAIAPYLSIVECCLPFAQQGCP